VADADWDDPAEADYDASAGPDWGASADWEPEPFAAELADWTDTPAEDACPPHAERPASTAAPPVRAPIFTNDRRVIWLLVGVLPRFSMAQPYSSSIVLAAEPSPGCGRPETVRAFFIFNTAFPREGTSPPPVRPSSFAGSAALNSQHRRVFELYAAIANDCAT